MVVSGLPYCWALVGGGLGARSWGRLEGCSRGHCPSRIAALQVVAPSGGAGRGQWVPRLLDRVDWPVAGRYWIAGGQRGWVVVPGVWVGPVARLGVGFGGKQQRGTPVAGLVVVVEKVGGW